MQHLETVTCVASIIRAGHVFGVTKAGKGWALTHLSSGLRVSKLPALGRLSKPRHEEAHDAALSILDAYTGHLGAGEFKNIIDNAVKSKQSEI